MWFRFKEDKKKEKIGKEQRQQQSSIEIGFIDDETTVKKTCFAVCRLDICVSNGKVRKNETKYELKSKYDDSDWLRMSMQYNKMLNFNHTIIIKYCMKLDLYNRINPSEYFSLWKIAIYFK